MVITMIISISIKLITQDVYISIYIHMGMLFHSFTFRIYALIEFMKINI